MYWKYVQVLLPQKSLGISSRNWTSVGSSVALPQRHGTYRVSLILKSFSESPAYHSSFDPKRHQSSIRYSPKGEIQSTSHNPVKTFGFRTNEVCLKWQKFYWVLALHREKHSITRKGRTRFELVIVFAIIVFKTTALNRSATGPENL